MLEHSFCHVPGIGKGLEAKLWEAGLGTWDEALAAAELPLAPAKAAALRTWLERSRQALAAGDCAFFAKHLPPTESWRLFGSFRTGVCYLDIETTGLGNPGDYITTIVTYDEREIRSFVHGRNLADFAAAAESSRLLVSFNGKRFDLPFIRRHLGAAMDQAHIDLCHVFRSLGYRGGLKGIEKQFGLDRRGLADVDGFFAVLLWHDYSRQGNEAALETLLAYNTLDVVNLAVLMAQAYNLKLAQTPFFGKCHLPVPVPPPLPFVADLPTIRRLRGEAPPEPESEPVASPAAVLAAASPPPPVPPAAAEPRLAPGLDALELAHILWPELPAWDLAELTQALGVETAADPMAALRARQTVAVRELSAPLLGAIQRVLAPLGQAHPLRQYFAALGAGQAGVYPQLFAGRSLPPGRRERREEADYLELPEDEVAGIFGAEGALARTLPGFELRHEQAAMARQIARSLNEQRHLLMEAGTGTGKSFAYLVPMLLWACRNDCAVIVSTNTRNLQSQLFAQDLPRLRQALGLDFRAALIKGRMNYLCLRKLLYLLRQDEGELEAEERVAAAAVAVWATRTESGDVSECAVLGENAETALTGKVTCANEECPTKSCPQFGACFLFRARRLALGADLVVANHAVVFSEMGQEQASQTLPPYHHLVLDEAHNLEDAATSHFSVEVSWPRLRYWLRRLWRPGRGGGTLAVLERQTANLRDLPPAWPRELRTLRTAVENVEAPAKSFLAALAELLRLGEGRPPLPQKRIRTADKEPEQWRPIVARKQELIAALARVTRGLRSLERMFAELPEPLPEQADLAPSLHATLVRLEEASQAIEFVMLGDDPGFVYWVEQAPERYGGAAFWAAPIHVGEQLVRDLIAPRDTVIFTSATLTVRGQTDFLRQRLGLNLIDPERLLEMRVGTPFDYARQCLAMVPTFMPEPGGDGDYPGALAELLGETVRRTRGRTMVLFTSYDMLHRCTEQLRRELAGSGIRVLAQGDSGSREAITSAFRQAREPTVLMGTHSFWEGVDIAGEALSCVVLARLPFAVFTDPLIEARCEALAEAGQDAFLGYSVPLAVIKFRQGFGRLIRRRDDHGIVIVADRRIVGKSYGEWFQTSIPVRAFPYARNDRFLEAIARFLG